MCDAARTARAHEARELGRATGDGRGQRGERVEVAEVEYVLLEQVEHDHSDETHHRIEGCAAERRRPFRGLCRAQDGPERGARHQVQAEVVARLEEGAQQASEVSAEQCRRERHAAKQLDGLHGQQGLVALVSAAQ